MPIGQTLLKPGERYVLPSGKNVEVLEPVNTGASVVKLAYVHKGRALPPGRGYSGHVTLRVDWFLVHAISE